MKRLVIDDVPAPGQGLAVLQAGAEERASTYVAKPNVRLGGSPRTGGQTGRTARSTESTRGDGPVDWLHSIALIGLLAAICVAALVAWSLITALLADP